MPGYTGFSNPPACVDCEHSWRGIGRPTYTRCARPTGERFDRVSGLLIDTVDRPARAERSRDRGLFSRALRCGPSGRFFEPKVDRRPAPPKPQR